MNEIIKQKKQNNSPDYIIKDNIKITNKLEMSKEFNEYFSTIGSSIGNQSIPLLRTDFKHYLTGNYVNSLFLEPVTESEIINCAKELKVGKSAGYDNIDPTFVKKTIFLYTKHLCCLFNESFISGTIPDQLKIAKVVPIYKSKGKECLDNYRPISILPVFSKILEKLVYRRLIDYIDKNNILFSKQFGFRQKYSTSMALIEFMNYVSRAIESKLVSIGIFLDLSKAFDSVNHSYLLQKLSFYGIRGISLNWFENYLNNRKQFVIIDQQSSDLCNVVTGIPQGSILGPPLFLLFINDLHYASSKLSFILFADDTNMFLSGKSVQQLNRDSKTELEKVSCWFYANKLKVNMTKTNYMVFKGRNINFDVDELHVQLNDEYLSRVCSTKFLGIYVDEGLNWKPRVNHIASKISSAIGILYVVHKLFPLPILCNLYNTLLLPYLSYANIVWGNCSVTLLNRLLVLQKKAIRLITKSSYRAHTAPLFKRMNILNVNSIYIMQLGQFMFQYKHNNLPPVFDDLFILNSSIHSYATRNANSFHIPIARTLFLQKRIPFNGPMLWSHLPPDIKHCSSLYSFKAKLRLFLLSNPSFTTFTYR